MVLTFLAVLHFIQMQKALTANNYLLTNATPQEIIAANNSQLANDDSSSYTAGVDDPIAGDFLAPSVSESVLIRGEDDAITNATIDVDTSTARSESTPSSNDGTKTNKNDDPMVFQNSFVWLNATRLSNANEVLMTEQFVHNLIMNTAPLDTLDGSKDALAQTMCFEDSTFMTWEEDHNKLKNSTSASASRMIEVLAYRLVFLAIHENQFGPARNEALARYSLRQQEEHRNDDKNSSSVLEKHNVGVFDYECDPNTKFLVTSHNSGMGFGATTRTQAVDQIHLAVSTGRVVLFMNTIPVGPDHMRSQYRAASCDRFDLQCVFLPMSPCVISNNDLENGTEISKEAYYSFLKTGKLDDELDKTKVLTLGGFGYKDKEPFLLREKYVNLISSLYDENLHKNKNSNVAWRVDKEILDKVKEVIMNEKYFPDDVALHYMLRPNLAAKQEMERIIDKVVPADFNPGSSIGLAIRASDKCGRESQCMPFSIYTQLIREFAKKRSLTRTGDNTTNTTLYDTVVLTSESKEMMVGRFAYTEKNGFPFRFVVNDEDVAQGSGQPGKFYENEGAVTPDRVMLSSLTAVKMQMLSESTVLNGCSSFHKIMASLLKMGCGRSKNNYMEFLGKNDNPEFRMRCT
jgi:hypothetical protein